MSDTRAFDMTIEIAVPPDIVWHALTTADELVNWFPTQATITPGKGGKWMVSWDGNWPWSTEIEIWEPGRHLRLADRNARPYDVEGRTVNQSVTPLPIAIDWYLEGKGGSTSLRLVHSGFGRGGAWDDEYDGVSTGWPLELYGLKHYLERHRGEQRQVAWSRIAVPVAPQVVWPRLVGPNGIVHDSKVLTLRPGDRYETTLATGDRIAGTVVLMMGDRGFQVTVDGWNGALYRLWIDRVGSESAVNSWLSAWQVAERLVQDFNARMRTEVDRVAAAVAVA
jgi:uncharacterized protein YndB with AHSA1/START domain